VEIKGENFMCTVKCDVAAEVEVTQKGRVL